MKKSVGLRFVFESGNDRIEELNWEGDVINKTYADRGTIEGLFDIYQKANCKSTTTEELDEIAIEDSFLVELV